MANIIVVEDDPNFNRILSIYLSNHGHQVQSALGAQEAYDKMYNQLFDMILSDVMMPNIDGFEFTETVRKINPNIPILFVTAKDDIQSKQRGFSSGIDDYMVKPIDMSEMLMRVTALLRRAHVANDRKLTIGNTVLDADSVSIMVDSQEISVTVREFNILFKLLSYPNKTFSRSQLLDEFWGVDTTTGLRAVDVYITKLRDKFSGSDVFEITTVHGLGYKAVLK
ncbi:MAG: response regulator transcription factor [Leuconostoc mesenteroides]|jgi:DNA-binding response OmpR family regulator|uniref:Heme response regulator HssR n=2 Tax=Leuconostoc mesenteroides TaxID=1245 RepID=Q03XL0_LEUMM|nr:response regulator transcription factor [Leuconostoc mesenteroides]ABJ62062.1 DNA-binding response regulator, OmpR family (Rec-wHTH domains) [Leuconostoc mesenteroides subsp. mesenteroides ATCC 8293]MBA5972894.1 response regulator transcription factor [Leuconostoc mesenteroides]MCI1877819.1 response regulator transcription factor [Leuconostoc mesenteroides]MCI1907360.1 response regulator transcription factor [Leuconostoc mesenteroides]MCT3041584.1 DNA-binding response regulator [Leuconostoc